MLQWVVANRLPLCGCPPWLDDMPPYCRWYIAPARLDTDLGCLNRIAAYLETLNGSRCAPIASADNPPTTGSPKPLVR